MRLSDPSIINLSAAIQVRSTSAAAIVKEVVNHLEGLPLISAPFFVQFFNAIAS